MNNYFITRANQSTHLKVVVTSLIAGIVIAIGGIGVAAA